MNKKEQFKINKVNEILTNMFRENLNYWNFKNIKEISEFNTGQIKEINLILNEVLK